MEQASARTVLKLYKNVPLSEAIRWETWNAVQRIILPWDTL